MMASKSGNVRFTNGPSAMATKVCHPQSGKQGYQDLPGDHHIINSLNSQMEIESKVTKMLNDAPSLDLSSLSSTTKDDKIQNIPVASSGLRSLSSAQALLEQSLHSGNSLTKEAEVAGKQNVAASLPSSNHMSQMTDTVIQNTFPTLQSTSNSSEDNTSDNELRNKSYKNITNTSPASSYVQYTLCTDLDDRITDVTPSHSDKNDLDRRINEMYRERVALPNNISNIKPSLSLNEDPSLTTRKSVTKSTQTDQDVASSGAAANVTSYVQTMSFEPSSSLPCDDILVRKLKLPVIQWLQRKLETRIGASWQNLADRHDWDYERITDFENHCSSIGESPFRAMLAEEEFQTYRLHDLKADLIGLPRKDILHDLDDVMGRHYK